MKHHKPFKIEFADSHGVKKRAREIHLILNIIDPDPKFQPDFLSDEALVLQSTRMEEDIVFARLRAYFGSSIELKLNDTFVELVDSIKRQIPNWPDNEG